MGKLQINFFKDTPLTFPKFNYWLLPIKFNFKKNFCSQNSPLEGPLPAQSPGLFDFYLTIGDTSPRFASILACRLSKTPSARAAAFLKLMGHRSPTLKQQVEISLNSAASPRKRDEILRASVTQIHLPPQSPLKGIPPALLLSAMLLAHGDESVSQWGGQTTAFSYEGKKYDLRVSMVYCTSPKIACQVYVQDIQDKTTLPKEEFEEEAPSIQTSLQDVFDTFLSLHSWNMLSY